MTPQHLDLTWGDSCGPDQNDFAVYEGTIGTWYSHAAKLCTTAGALGVANVTPAPESSYYLVVALSTNEEGSYGRNSGGAEIPSGISTCRAAQSTSACEWKRVFVSSVSFTGNMGGLVGADQACQVRATAAALGGTWRAWLSGSTASALSRIAWSSLSYRRVDGALIAANDASFRSSLHVSPINLDEHGVLRPNVGVWTGSLSSGAGFGSWCMDWTSSSGASSALVGNSERTDGGWSAAGQQPCNASLALYCIEQ